MAYTLLHTKPSMKHFFMLFFIALGIRSAVFYFYVQHKERYRQADSRDYHQCSLILAHTKTMTRPDTQEPIFWRTPGYPFYLSLFYRPHRPLIATDFSFYAAAQKKSIWMQIIFCSFIPIILFFIALLLTSSYPISWIIAWISVFHLGFVLASTYLLTDALASVFFYLFLLCFYQFFRFFGEPKINAPWLWWIIAGACNLSLFTWMRPMGIYIGLFASVFLILSNDAWFLKLKKILLFLLVFFGTLSPWYIRNYDLTGKIFFCPMSGGILQAFVTPKIIRRLAPISLPQAVTLCFRAGAAELERQTAELKAQGSTKIISKHLVCQDILWPIIKAYPWYAAQDWAVQVAKTAFDLYASQLVAFATNTYTYDPAEEFLTEKVAACLYKEPLNWFMRLLAWLEFLSSIFLWLGLCGGFWIWIIKAFYQKIRSGKALSHLTFAWLKALSFIGFVTFMTGGFGYARLRIPVEPLMIILAVSFWYFMYVKWYQPDTTDLPIN